MGGMEFNKIFAALLVAGIVAMFSGFIAKQFTATHPLTEDAYHIEGVVAEGGSAAEPMAEPVLAMIAAADIAKGQKISKACASCHNFEKGGPNGIGPNLYGIVGRAKESHAGFSYSGALHAQGGNVWTYEEMNKFLWKPKKYAPDSKMNFIGIKKPEDRAALLAWLHTLGSTKPLPSAAEIAQEEADLAPPVATEAPATDAAAPAEAPAAH